MEEFFLFTLATFPFVLAFAYMTRKDVKDRISLTIDGFLDNYELIDFENVGRVKKDYMPWTAGNTSILVEGVIEPRKSFLRYFASNSALNAELFDVEIPPGFSIELRQDGALEVFAPNYEMPIYPNRKGAFEFFIHLSQRENDVKIDEPVLIQLKFKVSERKTHFFFWDTYSKVVRSYDFFIGPELGDVWIGLDPGTSGSCVAAARSNEGVVIEQDAFGKEKITPSKLTFDKNAKLPDVSLSPQANLDILEDIYKFGFQAEKEFSLSTVWGFQSIKKLLGYKDEFLLEFTNGNSITANGKILSSLLIKALSVDFFAYINRNKRRLPALSEGSIFEPKRAVVAMPNNFTATKMQDLLNCVKAVDSFKEVRLITEAEAAICYYIYNHDKLHPSKEGLKDETVLIFDMGGATINTIVADVFIPKEEGKIIYEIDVESKIGYGIGGDTIDYCLVKTLFAFPDEFPELTPFNPFGDRIFNDDELRNLKNKMKDQVLILKREIIQNYGDTSKMDVLGKAPNPTKPLLGPKDIENFFLEISGINIKVPKTSVLLKQFQPNPEGDYPVFGNEYFQNLVYLPVREAVRDASALSDGEGGYINTVLFSGRSSLFPKIGENVKMALGTVKNMSKRIESEYIKPNFIFLQPDELKTAVVKGAAWYGAHKNTVRLNPQKIHFTIGVKRNLSALRKNIEFIPLIEPGKMHHPSSNGEEIRRWIDIRDDFLHDGNMVNFYQVMGKNPKEIIQLEQKHKYNQLTSIFINQSTKKVGVRLDSRDKVYCSVQTVGGNEPITKVVGEVEQDIIQDNEEHYTWVIH